MSEPYILIAEDDAELRHLLGRGLREEGFRIEAVSTGAELLELAGQSTGHAGIVRLRFAVTPGVALATITGRDRPCTSAH